MIAMLASNLGAVLAGVVALLGAVVLGWSKAKATGVAQARAQEAQRTAEAVNVRTEEDAVAARAADPAAQLRKRWGR